MATVRDDIQAAIGEVFNTLRDDVFFESTDTLELIKASDTADEFDQVIELTDWFFEKDAQGNINVRIAKSFEDLTDSVEVATHVRHNNDVYVISRGDIKPPVGNRVFWEMFCERYPRQAQYSDFR